jgi:hypothetical protein
MIPSTIKTTPAIRAPTPDRSTSLRSRLNESVRSWSPLTQLDRLSVDLGVDRLSLFEQAVA